MGIFQKTRTKKGSSVVRIVSAILVLCVLVLVIAESAKYFYSLKLPESVSSKIAPSVNKLAVVLGAAKTSVKSLDDNVGNVFVKDEGEAFISRDVYTESAFSKRPDRSLLIKIAVLSDSHNDFKHLSKAIESAKNMGVSQVLFLGGYTDWGELKSLEKSKKVMDEGDVAYFSLPGDHDLAETRDESNFIKVFGGANNLLDISGTKLILFNNSKNYTVIDNHDMEWLSNSIQSADFLLLSQPLLTENMSRVMGIVDGVKDAQVFAQNTQIIDIVRNSTVKAVISGDLHMFSVYDDPVKAGLKHYTVGAVLQSQSLEKLNLQTPRFAVLNVYDDKSYEIEDITIE